MYNIHLLPALFGDAILIEYGQTSAPKYILIDGGPYYGYEKMMAGLRRVAPTLKKLELLVATHIDIDHIDGVITLLNQKPLPIAVNEIWFNGFRQINHKSVMEDILGTIQGEYFSLLIEELRLPHNTAFGGLAVMVHDDQKPTVHQLSGGFEITLLAPSKMSLRQLQHKWEKDNIDGITTHETVEKRWADERRYGASPTDLLGGGDDTSVPNLSSIAFLGTYGGKTCLFAGDAPASELLPGIQAIATAKGTETLKLDAWKLAHHGSQRSTNEELMKQIDAARILVSTNGAIHHLPNRKCIDAVIRLNNQDCQLYFNYLSEETAHWNDPSAFPNAHFPTEGDGISVQL